LDFRDEEKEKSHDFVYIGAMSAERRTNLMLDSFLGRYGSAKTFLLLGLPESTIVKRYSEHPNIIFAGRKSQPEVFRLLQLSRCAVNYFPVHYPHVLQTPPNCSNMPRWVCASSPTNSRSRG